MYTGGMVDMFIGFEAFVRFECLLPSVAAEKEGRAVILRSERVKVEQDELLIRYMMNISSVRCLGSAEMLTVPT